MRDSEYNCAVASSEYNEALRAREYTPAREYGATEQRRGERKKKRSSARQRALMQATAAVMTVVVAVSAAAGDIHRYAEPDAEPSEWSEPLTEPVSQPDSDGILGEPKDDVIALTAEQKAFLDELYAACLAEDDAIIHALSHTPMLEEVVALGDFLYDGTQAVAHMTAGTPAMSLWYSTGEHAVYRRVLLYLDGLDTQAFGRIVNYTSSLNDVGVLVNFSSYLPTEVDTKNDVTAFHGYVRRGTLTPGSGYDALSRSELYSERTGDFVSATESTQYPDMTVSFLENGTVITNQLTYDLGLPPQQFEVRNGYLDPGSLLTAETWDDGTVFLNFNVVLPDGSSSGCGVGANWPDDPFYHTPLQS